MHDAPVHPRETPQERSERLRIEERTEAIIQLLGWGLVAIVIGAFWAAVALLVLR